jgi:hypothetical protein
MQKKIIVVGGLSGTTFQGVIREQNNVLRGGV